MAGRKLADSGIDFDLALCSTATRTRETWKLAVHEFAQRPRTVYEERLYDASLGELVALFNETPDEVRNLLVIGHNPGMHGAADALSGSAEADTLARMTRDGFPTAAYAVVEFSGSWKSVELGSGKLTEYWTPND